MSCSFFQRRPTDCGTRCVRSRTLENEEALALCGLSRQKQTEVNTENTIST
jgi:hypothetical protein